MKKWLMALVFGSVLVLGACGGDDAEEAPEEEPTEEEVVEEEEADMEEETDEGETVADVEELYKDSCASCHSGDFELVPGETDLSVDEMEDIILNGVGDMPAIDVSDDEATAIAEYLVD